MLHHNPSSQQKFHAIAKIPYLTKMVKSARKSETETFGIVGRFHRFEDVAPTSVHRVNMCTFLYSTYRKKKLAFGVKTGKRVKIRVNHRVTSVSSAYVQIENHLTIFVK